ncbi:MAG: 30S ribosomal protein S16 [Zetaproteobacteria bacterium]|nr:MAG: 30S ribosomal protein S16 [Zetaproteobacteria bacterium]
MATVIRLQRRGRKKRPFYSIVVTDERNRRDGAAIERLGYLNPLTDPEEFKIDLERVELWQSRGARVSQRVAGIIERARAQQSA